MDILRQNVRYALRRLRQSPGFTTENLVTMSLRFRSNIDSPDRQQTFLGEIAERVEALPGVDRAGFIHILHIDGDTWTADVAIDGWADEDRIGASVRTVTPELFEVMQVPVLRGRAFDARDTSDGLPVAILNRTFAGHAWPDTDPIGQRVKRGDDDLWLTVIGVVDDVHQDTVVSPVRPEIYFPYTQNPFAWSQSATLVVRGRTGQPGFVDAVRNAVWTIDPNLPLTRVRTSAQLLDDVMARDRFTTWLLASFAAVAVALALIGIHGVIAYTVGRRTREFGIRIALGATRAEMLAIAVGQGLRLAVVGALLGLLCAYAGARALDTLLFGVSATDPATFVVVTAMLLVVATGAC